MSEFTLVIVESPYAARDKQMTEEERAADIERNVAYARACMHDCLMRGEAPFASHLLYTQPGVLKDGVPEERRLGIDAGLAWGRKAQKTVVYCDRGYTVGMYEGIKRAEHCNRPVDFRRLGGEWAEGAAKAEGEVASVLREILRHSSNSFIPVDLVERGERALVAFKQSAGQAVP